MSGRNISLSPESFSLQLQEKLSKGQKLDGIFKKSFYENKSIKAKGLYAVKNAAGMFDEFYDLVSFAKGGNIDDAQLAILGMLLGTNFLEDILMSLTLDVMQTPMREFMEEGVKESEIKMNLIKYEGIRRVEYLINNDVFLTGKYFTKEISYETMKNLLNGKVKKQEDLKFAYGEVILLLKKINEGVLIDSFFINSKE